MCLNAGIHLVSRFLVGVHVFNIMQTVASGVHLECSQMEMSCSPVVPGCGRTAQAEKCTLALLHIKQLVLEASIHMILRTPYEPLRQTAADPVTLSK